MTAQRAVKTGAGFADRARSRRFVRMGRRPRSWLETAFWEVKIVNTMKLVTSISGCKSKKGFVLLSARRMPNANV